MRYHVFIYPINGFESYWSKPTLTLSRKPHDGACVVREVYRAVCNDTGILVEHIADMSSWIRVAQGLQKVASAASRKVCEDTSIGTSRLVQHAVEVSSRLVKPTATQGIDTSPLSRRKMYTSNHPNPSMETTNPNPDTPPNTQAVETTQTTPTAPDNPSSLSDKDIVALEETVKRSGNRTEDPHSMRPENTIRFASDQQQDSMSDFATHGVPQSTTRMKEGAPVPSTRWGRALGFANLGLGLAYGAAGEGARRLLFPTPPPTNATHPQQNSDSSSSIVMTDANADRLAATLCRMRGAALKLGQMLSIQDASLLPPPLTRALAQVRQGAAAMPAAQLHDQLVSQYGRQDWRHERFVAFDPIPCAAASIGQVHRAVLRTPQAQHDVVVKVQYPGVADSISSDLRNLGMLVQWSGVMPKGLFIENVMRVGEQELRVECDYVRERKNQQRMQQLVHEDVVLHDQHGFRVPDVYEEWCTEQVLVTGFAPGGTVDRIADTASQEERNRLGRGIIDLTMKELFTWRFMQTDPNWGNFLYDVGTGITSLIDFGATREFSKTFVDGYLRIVWAAANRDEETLLTQSHTMHFLTGQENAQMIRAHTLSGFTVGEPFASDEPFDFRGSRISERMGEHTSVFLKHRLTPPPEEVYTLHRKLAGAYMLCIKLGSVFSARDLLFNLVKDHTFEDGLPHPMDR